MEREKDLPGFRVVQLIQRDPPPEILRHAEMIPGETGRYGKVVRFRHEKTRTVYEVLHFKAGRPPSREEILSDLRSDLAKLDAQSVSGQGVGPVSGWIDRNLFAGTARGELERKRRDILETIRAVEEQYKPGEAVAVP